MIYSLLLLIVGLMLLVVGAELVVRGGASLARTWEIRPLIIGLTVVAFGTSAPELAVSIKSALADQGGVAAGNVIGSNIFNIAAILGLSALVFPLKVDIRLIRFEIPLMIAVTVVAMVMLENQVVTRMEGILLVAGFLAYMAAVVTLAKRESPASDAQIVSELPPPLLSFTRSFIFVIAGLIALVAGADWFVRGAVAIAKSMQISEAVIGLTIVAAGTSLPELATTIVAAFRRHTDIAVGNIIGSNLFNILAILGITGLIKPFATTGIVPLDYASMLFFAILLFPLACTGFILNRWEGGLLFAGYAGFVIYRLLNM